MKNSFLDKLLHRMDRVGSDDLQIYLQRLAKEKGFLETIFNTLQEGILVVDQKGKILYFNSSAQNLIGIPNEKALDEPIAKYLRDFDWKTILEAGKVHTRDIEVTYPEERFLSSYIVPLTDDHHMIHAYALILHDLTRYREKTLETIESEKLNALTVLAAGVAHELGNPLNSLNIHFQLLERELRKKGGDSPDIQEHIRVVRGEIERLDTIIHQFLQALRPTTLERTPASINEVIHESLTVLKPEIQDRDILLETDYGIDLPPVEIDRNRMKQVFYNLIKNAIQATRKGGVLKIATGANDTHLLIAFIDNGVGIPAENIARLSEPFFTTKPMGSGLGLLIVRRIIREHGGELQIDSQEGHGTTVRLLLPLTEKRVRLLT